PVYYLLASLPLWMMPFLDIEGQLYAVRLVSLTLYLITILVSWLIAVELTPKGHPLRIIMPLSLALLPGFVDLMTAVNSDVGAIVLFSIFLWGAVRLILRGFSWFTFFWMTLAVILIYWTKETAFAVFPLYIIVLIFSVFTGSKRWVAWSLLAISAVAGLVAIFSWGDAAFWARNTLQENTTRIITTQAPLGRYVFQVENNQDGRSYYQRGLYQLIPLLDAGELSGKTLTLGAWMWASEPVKVRTPMIKSYGNQEFYKEVELDERPVFYAFTVKMDGNTMRSWVSLVPFDKGDTREVIIYYDGIVLVEGRRPLKIEPIFEDRNGNRGTWGGQPFDNLLRNPSAELSWPQIRHWAEALGEKYLPDFNRPSWIMATLADWPGAGWFFDISAKNLLRTFWAKFGWGHVVLMGHKPYRILGVVTALGIFGAIIALWRKRCTAPWDIIILFSLALLAVWGFTFVRGTTFIVLRPYYPSARSAYPAIIPTMFLLVLGWWELIDISGDRLKIPDWGKFTAYFVPFLFLITWSIISIIRYYAI
ncbi:MAG: hypothetical protein KAS38_23005, partial [Anaerolineales bacterium]|nr:hypothetical protein [Anaerolineales bacterium]